MPLSDEEIKQLEAYYGATLPPPIHEAIAERLRNDPEYNASAQAFLNTLEALERSNLRARRWYIANDPKTHTEPKGHGQTLLLLLLSGVVLLGIVWSTMRSKGDSQPKDREPNDVCAMTFSEHYPRLGNKLSSGLSNSTLREGLDGVRRAAMSSRDSALNWYEARCYERAIPLLQRTLARERNDTVRLYLGVAQLAAAQYTAAKSNFDTLRLKGVEPRPAILWYSAYAANEVGDRDEALALLSLLQVTGDARWAQKADELAQKIQQR